MKFCFAILLLIFFSSSINAQDSDSGYVNIHADPRLEILMNRPSKIERRQPTKIRGYRIQIYNGNDRKKASEKKLEFMRVFPEVRSYLTYYNPQFRVRIGDFKSRAEAMELYNQLSGRFTPIMIVPDVININVSRNKNKNSELNTDD